jgi:hypothetical protein
MSYSRILFNFLKENTQQIIEDLRFSKEVCIERGLQDKVDEINVAIEQNKELGYYIEQQLIELYILEEKAQVNNDALFGIAGEPIVEPVKPGELVTR